MNLVLDALNSIDPDKVEEEVGICDLVKEYLSNHSQLNYGQVKSLIDGMFRPLFVEWPEYSGNQVFPVPSPVDHINERDYYMLASTAAMWSKDSPYGASRRRLLTFLITFLITELEKQHA